MRTRQQLGAQPQRGHFHGGDRTSERSLLDIFARVFPRLVRQRQANAIKVRDQFIDVDLENVPHQETIIGSRRFGVTMTLSNLGIGSIWAWDGKTSITPRNAILDENMYSFLLKSEIWSNGVDSSCHATKRPATF